MLYNVLCYNLIMGNDLWPCSEVASSPTKVLMLSVLSLHLIIWGAYKILKRNIFLILCCLTPYIFEKYYSITAAKCITIEVGLEIQPHKFAFKLPKKTPNTLHFLLYASFSKELKVNSEKTKSQRSLNSLLFQPNSKWWWNLPWKVQTTGRCEIASLKKQHSAQSKFI